MTGNQTPGTGSTRDAVVDRYSGLARTALAGGAIADDGTDSAQLAESEPWAGCVSVTQPQYRDLLLTAGFTTISITSTHQAGLGLHSAIIQAAKPAAHHT